MLELWAVQRGRGRQIALQWLGGIQAQVQVQRLSLEDCHELRYQYKTADHPEPQEQRSCQLTGSQLRDGMLWKG